MKIHQHKIRVKTVGEEHPLIDPKKLEAAIVEVAKSPIPDEMFLAAYNVLLADPFFRDDYQGSLSDLVEEMLVAALRATHGDELIRLIGQLKAPK